MLIGSLAIGYPIPFFSVIVVEGGNAMRKALMDSFVWATMRRGGPLTIPRATMTAVTTLALMACSASGFAADVQRGKQFASRVCGIYHVVFEGQSPRNPNAPSFQSVANSPQFREKGVRLLWEQHPTMPNISLTKEQSDDLAAYIKSLAK